MQITYQKKDGTVMQKYRNTLLPYKIGEITSMGWKVLDIKYEYKNEYYPEYKYNILMQKDKQAYIKKKNAISMCKSELKKFLYCFATVLIIFFFKTLLGI